MTNISCAVGNNPIQRLATYYTQFRLRMAKIPNRSWATIDGHLWLSCGLSDDFLSMPYHLPLVTNIILRDFVVELIVGILMLALNVRCSTLRSIAIFSMKPNPIGVQK